MLDNIDGYLEAILENSDMRFIQTSNNAKTKCMSIRDEFIGELYCPNCGANRKHKVNLSSDICRPSIIENDDNLRFSTLPVVHEFVCLQCGKGGILVLYKGVEEYELAVLRNTYGGCFTPNTPKEIKYYLDQAYKSRMVGALSASMVMYRTALEWVLYDQGYKDGMLRKKIEDIEKDIKNGTAPQWASSLPVEMISAIKNIGNGAAHTNNGNIDKQNSINKTLLEVVDVVFSELLDVIYEQPIRRKENLEKLKDIGSRFNK